MLFFLRIIIKFEENIGMYKIRGLRLGIEVEMQIRIKIFDRRSFPFYIDLLTKNFDSMMGKMRFVSTRVLCVLSTGGIL